MRLVMRVKGVKIARKRLSNGATATYYYHRATMTRLPDDPSSPDFFEAWKAAEDGMKPKRRTDTIGGLIDLYRDSSAWLRLRESTRQIGAYNLAAVAKEFGTMPVSAVGDARVRGVFLKWRDDLARDHPRAADAKLGALQRVLSFAVDRGFIDKNPIANVEGVYRADRSDVIWDDARLERLLAVAEPDVAWMVRLALDTAQRVGDLRRLTWSAYDGRDIRLVQSKTKRAVVVPCRAGLIPELDRRKAERGSCLYIAHRGGKPWSEDAFKKAFARAKKLAGIKEKITFHDLRGTALTRLFEAECTVAEAATISGHSLLEAQRIMEVYLARKAELARNAVAKLDRMANRNGN